MPSTARNLKSHIRYKNSIKGGRDDYRFFKRKQKSDRLLYHFYSVLEFMYYRCVLYDPRKIAQRRMDCSPELSGNIKSKINIHTWALLVCPVKLNILPHRYCGLVRLIHSLSEPFPMSKTAHAPNKCRFKIVCIGD